MAILEYIITLLKPLRPNVIDHLRLMAVLLEFDSFTH